MTEESQRSEGLRARFGRKTLDYMDQLAEAAARRKLWVSTARFLGLEPKALAMTVAEAIVIYKVSFIFLGPLTFFALVKLFQKENKAEVSEFIRDYRKDLVDVVVEPEANVSRWLKSGTNK